MPSRSRAARSSRSIRPAHAKSSSGSQARFASVRRCREQGELVAGEGMNAPRPNLAGIRVAVTRDEPADGPLSTALREHGLEPVACPAVRELPAPDPIALRESAIAAD